MKRTTCILFICIISLFMVSCNRLEKTAVGSCPDAKFDYIAALQFNDVTYVLNNETDTSHLSKGGLIGEVHYMLSGSACSGYRMKNGDATLLPKGTEIYEAAGYKPDYRLIADGKLYEASNNPKAQTVSDVYDVANRIIKVSFESPVDGTHLSDFTSDEVQPFAEQWLSLKYVEFDEIYKSSKGLDGDRFFLRIYLKDGTSFRIVYWLDNNAITPGAYGTEKLKAIVLQQKKD